MSCISRLDLCPASGDSENVLLQKILQSVIEGSGGGGVTGLSVNGGPFQTGQVSIVTGGGGVTSVNGDPGPAVSLDSGDITEAGNLYFTTARVRATDLTGFASALGAITAADTVLSAFGKAQGRLAALEAGTAGPFVLRAGDTMTGALLHPAGTAALPSISFSSDPDTGIYSNAPGFLSFSVDAAARVTIDALSFTATVPFLSVSGTAAAPQYSFISNPDIGMYNAAGSLGFSTGGVARLTLSTASLTSTLPFLGANGTAALPEYSFSGDPNTGIYNTGVADTLGFSTGGTVRLTLNTANLTSTLAILGPDGTVALPSFSFSSDPNTGIFQTGIADTLGLVTAGSTRLTINTASVTSSLPVLAPPASAAAPSFAFSVDSDTGFFRAAANSIGMSAGGVVRVTLDTASLTSTLPFLGPTGLAGAPTYSFSGDADTGMYRAAADVLAFSVASGGQLQLTTTLFTSLVATTAPSVSATVSLDTPRGVIGQLEVGTFVEDATTPFGPGVFDGASFAGAYLGSIGSAATMNLPAVSAGGRVLFIKDVFGDAETFNLTIVPAGADTIDGAASYVINTNYGSVILVALPGWGRWSIVAKRNTFVGNATLVAGTKAVAFSGITASTVVMLTRKTSGGTIGTAISYTIAAGTGFTINSDSVLDTSTFSYSLAEPA